MQLMLLPWALWFLRKHLRNRSASQVINMKDMKLQTKWKVGTVYRKLANGQETKGGSKKLKGD